jgi:hypothetical protein
MNLQALCRAKGSDDLPLKCSDMHSFVTQGFATIATSDSSTVKTELFWDVT